MEKIGIVVLNYKNFNETINCVESLLQQNNVNYEIIIIDNGSGNQSIDVLRDRFKGIESVGLVSLNKNIGYAKGNNVGIKMLRAKGCSSIFVANSDLVFHSPNTLRQILDEYEPGVGLIDPIIKNTNMTIEQRVSYKKKYLYLRILKMILCIFINKFIPDKSSDSEGSIEWSKKLLGLQKDRYVVSGSGFLLTADFFKYYNGLFPKTFLYFEEWGTIILLHKVGLMTKIANCDYILHIGAASTPEDIRNITKKRKKIMRQSGWQILWLIMTPRKVAIARY